MSAIWVGVSGGIACPYAGLSETSASLKRRPSGMVWSAQAVAYRGGGMSGRWGARGVKYRNSG